MSTSSTSAWSKPCTLAVELPASIVTLLAPTSQEAARRLAELAYIELFRQGELSGGKAAELLGLSRAEWLDLLVRHGVPHAVVTEESLEHDLKVLAGRKTRLSRSSPTPDR